MAEVTAFLLAQYQEASDQLVASVQQRAADDVEQKRTAAEAATKKGAGGGATNISKEHGDSGGVRSAERSLSRSNTRTERVLAFVPEVDGANPVMRRASWVEAPVPTGEGPPAGFGLPRTPLRLLSLAARTHTHTHAHGLINPTTSSGNAPATAPPGETSATNSREPHPPGLGTVPPTTTSRANSLSDLSTEGASDGGARGSEDGAGRMDRSSGSASAAASRQRVSGNGQGASRGGRGRGRPAAQSQQLLLLLGPPSRHVRNGASRQHRSGAAPTPQVPADSPRRTYTGATTGSTDKGADEGCEAGPLALVGPGPETLRRSRSGGDGDRISVAGPARVTRQLSHVGSTRHRRVEDAGASALLLDSAEAIASAAFGSGDGDEGGSIMADAAAASGADAAAAAAATARPRSAAARLAARRMSGAGTALSETVNGGNAKARVSAGPGGGVLAQLREDGGVDGGGGGAGGQAGDVPWVPWRSRRLNAGGPVRGKVSEGGGGGGARRGSGAGAVIPSLPGQVGWSRGGTGTSLGSLDSGKMSRAGSGGGGGDKDELDFMTRTHQSEVDWWILSCQESHGGRHAGGPASARPGLRQRHRRASRPGGDGAGGGGAAAAPSASTALAAVVAAGAWKGKLRRRQTAGEARTGSGGSAGNLGSLARLRSSSSGLELGGGPGAAVETPLHAERVPWYVVALDLWVTADKYQPLFMPSPGRTSWDFLMLLVLLFTAVAVPLEAGFRATASQELDAVNSAVLAVFWVDIWVNFRTVYISDTGELVRNTRQIAAHYSRTWLPLDLASALPWAEVLRAILASRGNHRLATLAALLRIPRLLRLFKVLRLLDRWRWVNALRLVRLFVFVVLVAHWTACAWHGMYEWIPGWPWIFTQLAVNAPGYDPNSLASQYSAALYYAFVLVVGSDNLPAANNVERVFYVLMLIAGAVMYALIISNMAALVADTNSLASRYRTKATLVGDVLRYMGAPQETRNRVADYYDFLATHEHPGPEADAFLSELPRALVEDVKWSAHSSSFSRLPLFAGCEEPFMAALQSRLTLLAFTPGEVLFKEGDMGQHMYLVRQGCVVLTSSSGDVSGMLHPGDCMGQLALLPDLAARRRPATATALRPTDVVALAGRDLALACRDHPASGSLVQERLMLQLEDLLHGTQWNWFIEKVLVPYELRGDMDEQQQQQPQQEGGSKAAIRHFSSSLGLEGSSFTLPQPGPPGPPGAGGALVAARSPRPQSGALSPNRQEVGTVAASRPRSVSPVEGAALTAGGAHRPVGHSGSHGQLRDSGLPQAEGGSGSNGGGGGSGRESGSGMVMDTFLDAALVCALHSQHTGPLLEAPPPAAAAGQDRHSPATTNRGGSGELYDTADSIAAMLLRPPSRDVSSHSKQLPSPLPGRSLSPTSAPQAVAEAKESPLAADAAAVAAVAPSPGHRSRRMSAEQAAEYLQRLTQEGMPSPEAAVAASERAAIGRGGGGGGSGTLVSAGSKTVGFDLDVEAAAGGSSAGDGGGGGGGGGSSRALQVSDSRNGQRKPRRVVSISGFMPASHSRGSSNSQLVLVANTQEGASPRASPGAATGFRALAPQLSLAPSAEARGVPSLVVRRSRFEAPPAAAAPPPPPPGAVALPPAGDPAYHPHSVTSPADTPRHQEQRATAFASGGLGGTTLRQQTSVRADHGASISRHGTAATLADLLLSRRSINSNIAALAAAGGSRSGGRALPKKAHSLLRLPAETESAGAAATDAAALDGLPLDHELLTAEHALDALGKALGFTTHGSAWSPVVGASAAAAAIARRRSGAGFTLPRSSVSEMGTAAAAAAGGGALAAAVAALLEPGGGSRGLLLALADAVVAHEAARTAGGGGGGSGSVGCGGELPAVGRLLEARGIEAQGRAEERFGGVLAAVGGSVEVLGATVSQLHGSLAAAARRIAAIERAVAEAAGEGVLAPDLQDGSSGSDGEYAGGGGGGGRLYDRAAVTGAVGTVGKEVIGGGSPTFSGSGRFRALEVGGSWNRTQAVPMANLIAAGLMAAGGGTATAAAGGPAGSSGISPAGSFMRNGTASGLGSMREQAEASDLAVAANSPGRGMLGRRPSRASNPTVAEAAAAAVAAAAAGGGSTGGNRCVSPSPRSAAALLLPPPAGGSNGGTNRRRSLDADAFSMLRHGYNTSAPSDLPSDAVLPGMYTANGGSGSGAASSPANPYVGALSPAGLRGATFSPAAARPRRRSNRNNIPSEGADPSTSAAGEASGGAEAAAPAATGAAATAAPSGPRGRRASYVMYQAGMLTPEDFAGSGMAPPPASQLNRLRHAASTVLDDSIVSGGGGGGGSHGSPGGGGGAAGLMPYERPGARRAPAGGSRYDNESGISAVQRSGLSYTGMFRRNSTTAGGMVSGSGQSFTGMRPGVGGMVSGSGQSFTSFTGMGMRPGPGGMVTGSGQSFTSFTGMGMRQQSRTGPGGLSGSSMVLAPPVELRSASQGGVGMGSRPGSKAASRHSSTRGSCSGAEEGGGDGP